MTITELERQGQDVDEIIDDLSPAEREAGLITYPELQELPKAPWLIDGVIRQRSLTFLYGKPDTFKTFIALDLCGALMTGRSWLEAEVTKSGPVLYWPPRAQRPWSSG